LLLQHGADINIEEADTKWNVLIFAAKSMNAEVFHSLVTNPDIKGPYHSPIVPQTALAEIFYSYWNCK